MINDLEILLRLLLAMGLCAMIGLERESRDQPAGLRTHIIVGMGSALFTLVSAYAFADLKDSTNSDPTRIAAQIVSGIGFLGAGAILRQGLNVRGLTTAATLWIVAAIGMACGAGYYFGAVATAALTLPALIIFRHLRGRFIAYVRQDVILLDLELEHGFDISKIFSYLSSKKILVQNLATELYTDDHDRSQLELRLPRDFEIEPVARHISRLPGVVGLSLVGRRWTFEFNHHS